MNRYTIVLAHVLAIRHGTGNTSKLWLAGNHTFDLTPEQAGTVEEAIDQGKYQTIVIEASHSEPATEIFGTIETTTS